MAILKNLIISAVGDVAPGSGKDYSQLRKWVEANGGRWMPRVMKGITHLICSKEAWKKDVEQVQVAKKLNAFVVSYDWLEDSLQGRRKLAEHKYTWEVLRRQQKKIKKIKKMGRQADTAKFRKGCEKAQEDIGSGTSSRKRSKGGFFASALDDLKKRREEREVEEKARRQGRADGSGIGASGVASEGRVEGQGEVPTSPVQTPPSLAMPNPTPPPLSIPKAQSKAPPNPKPSDGILGPSSAPAPASAPTPGCCSNPPTPTYSQPPTNKLKDLYHVYTDTTGFTYDLLLLRQNPFLNTFAKYELRLYESHAKPHVYCTFVRYTPPASSTSSAPSGVPIIPSRIRGMHDGAAVGNSSGGDNKQGGGTASNEKARLDALITEPTARDDAPYKALLVPANSAFPPAFAAFRHAFRDLTLLTWEERLDDAETHPLQRARAQALAIEPFLWKARPVPGLPVGLLPAVPLPTAADASYVRNRWNLPGVQAPLSTTGGAIGSALHREAEETRKREEDAARFRAEAREKTKGGARKPNWNKPLFNGVNGRPRTDAYGRYVDFRSGVTGAGVPGSRPGGGSATGRAVVLDRSGQRGWIRGTKFGYEG